MSGDKKKQGGTPPAEEKRIKTPAPERNRKGADGGAVSDARTGMPGSGKKPDKEPVFDRVYLKSVASRVLSALLALCAVFYVVWHMTGGFESAVQTVTALSYTASDTVKYTGYIFRDETPVYSSYNGTVSYAVADGERAAVGAHLADVYEDTSGASALERLSAIDSRIALLESCALGSSAAFGDTGTVDSEITKLMLGIRREVEGGELAGIDKDRDSLLSALCRRALIISGKSDYSAATAELSAQRTALAATVSGRSESVKAARSGYFYHSADGYESSFTASAALGITTVTFAELTSGQRDSESLSSAGKYAVGKLATDYLWYLAVGADRSLMSTYREGGTYPVEFPYSGITLDMELVRVSASGDSVVYVFSCGRLPDGFDFTRSQKVGLSAGDYSGLRVPSSALHLLEGHTGVYIMYGSTVLFRAADLVGEADGYAYISEASVPFTLYADDDNGENDVYCAALRLYDSVIVSGTDLYPGKIIK